MKYKIYLKASKASAARSLVKELNAAVHPQRAAPERGEFVIALESDHVERFESRFAGRHPEVPILGSDLPGTPALP